MKRPIILRQLDRHIEALGLNQSSEIIILREMIQKIEDILKLAGTYDEIQIELEKILNEHYRIAEENLLE